MGIVRAAYALPRLRTRPPEGAAAWGAAEPRGIARRSVPAWDEDEVTLAAEALRALGDLPPITLLAFGAPDGAAGAATLAEALDAKAARALDVGGGAHAGLAALLAACEHAVATGGHALASAASVPRSTPGSAGEHAEGAGAAAFLVAPRGGAVVASAASVSAETLGDLPPLSPAHRIASRALLALPAWRAPAVFVATPPGRYEGPGGKPIEAFEPFRADAGELGCAFLADLAEAFRASSPGTRIVAAAAGPGAATAAAFDVETAIDVRRSTPPAKEIAYLRHLQERRALAPPSPDQPMGAFVSPAAFVAEIDARYRLAARRCPARHLHFPPRPACPVCASPELQSEPLAGPARIVTWTIIGRGGAPGEFAAEQAAVGEYPVAVVEFPEGPRATVRIADADRDDLAIGLPVRPAFRRLYEQQGRVRYGLKFVPDRHAE